MNQLVIFNRNESAYVERRFLISALIISLLVTVFMKETLSIFYYMKQAIRGVKQ